MAGHSARTAQASTQDIWRRRLAWILLVLSIALFIGSISLWVLALRTPTTPSTALEQIRDVPLPAGRLSFDQMAVDPTTKKLFIAHAGGSEVVIVDLTTNKVAGRILKIPKNHGIVVIPNLKRIYVSETLDNQVYVIDEKTLQIMTKIPVGQKPDMIAYDPTDAKLFVSTELGQSDTVIDVNTNRVLANIPLKGAAGNTRYDPALHRIFVSVQTTDQVVAIDPATLQIVGTVTLPRSCQTNHGLILDVAQHLGFVACVDTAQLVVLNMQSLQVLSTPTQTLGADPDVMAFDDSRHLLYVASHQGVLSIFSDQAETVQKVHEEGIASDAHSIFANWEDCVKIPP